MEHLDRASIWVGKQLARSPGTFVYVFVVGITTWTLASIDERAADVLLRQVSTNLVQMSNDAPRVLVLSAFMLDGGSFWIAALTMIALNAPLERWVGTRRWLVVVVSGHMLASLIVSVGLWLQIESGASGVGLVFPVDVGISYATSAAGAAVAYRLPRVIRPVWVLGVAVAYGFLNLFRGPTFTDVGHMCAITVGLVVGALITHTVPRGDFVPMPRELDWRAWWRWISTPPPRRLGRVGRWIDGPGRVQLAGACFCLVLAVGFGLLGVANHRRHHESKNSSTPTVRAQVEQYEPVCASGCPRITVAYTYKGKHVTEAIPAPTGVVPHVGQRVLVELDSSGPQVSVQRVKVDAAGFLWLGAGTLALIGLILAIGSMHDRRSALALAPP